MAREENAIILDFLPYGYPLENKRMPLAQAIGKSQLTLLQLVPRRGEKFEIGEVAYIGDGKRDKVQYILGRCPREKLTETARVQLEEFIEKNVKENEEKYVKFFNEAQAINTRLHQFELLPGLGKKHTNAILAAREEKEFESFDDIRERVHNMPSPEKVVEKRVMEELTEIQRHNLFIS
jgi:putative nucleotide binding protein